MKSTKVITLCVAIFSTALATTVSAGTTVSATPQTIQGLGTTAFATSTKSSEAQGAFIRGLLLLHAFEYSDAAAAFVSAEKLDPAFSMAYWGEAMTFNHGVWNQMDATAGKAALDKFAPTAAARALRMTDPREKAYMAAVELLYDGMGTKADRDKRYSEAMERLSASYPDDRNAQLFYSLALLSQSEGVRDVPVYLHAADIAKTIFRVEPDNPGAAHYWIHGMDDPDHAAGALEAARALSKIAPEAPHAQHMCSHIFMALGMWDDVVQANVEAIRVGTLRDRADGFPPYSCGHYPEWLEYGYFQQGRIRAALKTVNECLETTTATKAWVAAHPGQLPYGAKDPAVLHSRLARGLADMAEVAVFESQNWGSAPQLVSDANAITPEANAWGKFTIGFAAAEQGNLTEARSALQAMHTSMEAMSAKHNGDAEKLQDLAVAAGELSGLIHVKASDYEAGSAEIRRAIESYRGMAFAFGPPVTVKPPEELLGEILLEKGDAAAARDSFEQTLQRAPGRTQSLLGLARSQRLAGDEISARETYAKLVAIWHDADAETPGLAEARKAVGAAHALGEGGQSVASPSNK